MTTLKLSKKLTIAYTSLLLLIISSCATVPLTGRKQFHLYSESDMIGMSITQYGQFMEQSKTSEKKEDVEMIKRCGNKIVKAVEEYMGKHGLSKQLENFQWEFNLVEDDNVNAWCMPGGKVVFYTGILPLTRNEAGVAVVMGHEIAHAVARHGNERMSHQMLAQLGGIALSEAIESKSAETQAIFMSAYGLGAQMGVMLPYSRKHEYEADKIGLMFMAMAGYNPDEAVKFWQRMSEMGGEKPPEFLSTHPVDTKRIENLKKHMQEAMGYYKEATK